jgi:hypothetical protein
MKLPKNSCGSRSGPKSYENKNDSSTRQITREGEDTCPGNSTIEIWVCGFRRTDDIAGLEGVGVRWRKCPPASQIRKKNPTSLRLVCPIYHSGAAKRTFFTEDEEDNSFGDSNGQDSCKRQVDTIADTKQARNPILFHRSRLQHETSDCIPYCQLV